MRPGKVDPKSLRTPVAFFFVAAAFYAGVAYTTGSFTRPVGLILLAMFVAYIVCNVLAMKNTPAPEEEEQAEEGPFAKELGLLVIGAVLIAVGADLLVDNGTLIAQALGVPESVIALTFVALGTSLPELVTAITSLAKGTVRCRWAMSSVQTCLIWCWSAACPSRWHPSASRRTPPSQA